MSYVYLIQSLRDFDTIYKIGYSKKPTKRIVNLQTGNDGKISIVHLFETKHGRKLETALHNFYSHARKNMEWFDLNLKEVNEFPSLCLKLENNLEIINKNNLYNDLNI